MYIYALFILAIFSKWIMEICFKDIYDIGLRANMQHDPWWAP